MHVQHWFQQDHAGLKTAKHSFAGTFFSYYNPKVSWNDNHIILFIRSLEVKLNLSNLLFENDGNQSCGKFI